MKVSTYVIFALMISAFAPSSNAQIFYNNPFLGRFLASYTTLDEIADDIPFSGTQHVGSFSFEYSNQNPAPVNATARFYAVGPNGGVGNLLATVPISNLAPGSFQFAAVNLLSEQQFDWSATPGIYGLASVTGGFFSLQFDAPNCGWYESEGPPSLDGFYDLSTGQFVTFNQDSNASFELQISQSSPFPALAINLFSLSVVGGGLGSGSVTIYPPRPTPVTLKLVTSKPDVVQVPPTVTIAANTTTASFTLSTKAVPADTVVWIAVRAGKSQKVVKLTVAAATP